MRFGKVSHAKCVNIRASRAFYLRGIRISRIAWISQLMMIYHQLVRYISISSTTESKFAIAAAININVVRGVLKIKDMQKK